MRIGGGFIWQPVTFLAMLNASHCNRNYSAVCVAEHSLAVKFPFYCGSIHFHRNSAVAAIKV